jgi:transaldolase
LAETYFTDLNTRTPTRVWVNNPTSAEVELALEQGAVGCTTNPAFGGGLLRRAPDEIRPVIDSCLGISDDDSAVADAVQQRLVSSIVDAFRPLHEASGGRSGFVSIQGAPDADHDSANILAEAHAGRRLGPNAVPKIPATAPGLEAFDALVEEGSPTIVTEVFSLSQLVETSERYLRVTAYMAERPPFFISPITGIFGDHLKALAARTGVEVDPVDAELAGVALMRACQRLVSERGYPVTLLAGGARTEFDLTGLVGAPIHATINWSTFAEIIERRTPLRRGIDMPIDAGAIQRLEDAFDDVRRALRLDGLRPAEFEEFGPVQHFRNNFLAGWVQVRAAIAEQRALVVN